MVPIPPNVSVSGRTLTRIERRGLASALQAVNLRSYTQCLAMARAAAAVTTAVPALGLIGMRSNQGRDELRCVGGPLDGERATIATGCRELLAPGGRYIRVRIRKRRGWSRWRVEVLQWRTD